MSKAEWKFLIKATRDLWPLYLIITLFVLAAFLEDKLG